MLSLFYNILCLRLQILNNVIGHLKTFPITIIDFQNYQNFFQIISEIYYYVLNLKYSLCLCAYICAYVCMYVCVYSFISIYYIRILYELEMLKY
jgi:hypothetical protein